MDWSVSNEGVKKSSNLRSSRNIGTEKSKCIWNYKIC